MFIEAVLPYFVSFLVQKFINNNCRRSIICTLPPIGFYLKLLVKFGGTEISRRHSMPKG